MKFTYREKFQVYGTTFQYTNVIGTYAYVVVMYDSSHSTGMYDVMVHTPVAIYNPYESHAQYYQVAKPHTYIHRKNYCNAMYVF